MLVPPPSEYSGEGCEGSCDLDLRSLIEIQTSLGPGLASDLASWMGPLQYLLTSLIFSDAEVMCWNAVFGPHISKLPYGNESHLVTSHQMFVTCDEEKNVPVGFMLLRRKKQHLLILLNTVTDLFQLRLQCVGSFKIKIHLDDCLRPVDAHVLAELCRRLSRVRGK
ncbi:hypothetical protein H8959_018886 [Pygathrix nigripes]